MPKVFNSQRKLQACQVLFGWVQQISWWHVSKAGTTSKCTVVGRCSPWPHFKFSMSILHAWLCCIACVEDVVKVPCDIHNPIFIAGMNKWPMFGWPGTMSSYKDIGLSQFFWPMRSLLRAQVAHTHVVHHVPPSTTWWRHWPRDHQMMALSPNPPLK